MGKFKHGDRVTCTIRDGSGDTDVKDGRISLSGTSMFICQDVKPGAGTREQFGYSHAWFTFGPEDKELYNLKLKKTMDNLEVGDVVINEYNREMPVIGVLGDVIFLECSDGDATLYSVKYLKKEDFKLKDAEEEGVKEVTMDDVCKEFGCTVKIKK